jgi:hypothetical protein
VTVPRRLAAFALVLAAAFGGGAAVGAVVGPIDVGGDEADDPHEDMAPDPASESTPTPDPGHDGSTGGHG